MVIYRVALEDLVDPAVRRYARDPHDPCSYEVIPFPHTHIYYGCTLFNFLYCCWSAAIIVVVVVVVMSFLFCFPLVTCPIERRFSGCFFLFLSTLILPLVSNAVTPPLFLSHSFPHLLCFLPRHLGCFQTSHSYMCDSTEKMAFVILLFAR